MALFTQALGALAGDGVGDAETAVADVLSAAAGPANNAVIDSTLSALAHRKALDLVVNGSADAIASANAAGSSAWAAAWSDTSDFNQVFAGDLAAILGDGGHGYRLFVVASATGSPADVLARLQAQEGWAPGGFDTFGIAEYGGLWVVIVADRSAGHSVISPGADTLDRITVYGDGAANDLYAGTRSANLFGLGGDDILHSGIGNDRLAGGGGNDRYVVHTVQDLVVEAVGQGYDTIFSSVSYALGAGSEVEALSTLDRLGTQAIDFTGNEFGNALYGNAGANRLSGGAGDDWLDGGDGDDRFEGGEGADTALYSTAGAGVTVSLALLGSAQNTGGAGIDTLVDVENLTGSPFGDTLTGNGFANVLNGLAGPDTMRGGAGDDTYVVDNAGDSVEELAGEGVDTVYTSLAVYSLLGTQIERLGAASDAPHDFRGSAGDNGISGGAGNDLFRLQDGGVDAVDGGAGNDAFYFGRAYTGADTVDGGEGRDQVALQGDYALTLGTLTSISDLILLSGTDTRFGDPGTSLYDYALTSIDSNVAAGATLLVDGTQLVAGESFTFNGLAESNGKFILSGGKGVDTLTGGAGADGFYFRGGTFWGPSDKVTGTASDQIGFRGDFTGANKVVMGADQIVGIVTLVLMSGTDTRFGAAVPPTKFDIAMNDGNVAPGLRFTIDGFFLGSDETMRIDGSAEQDGFFRMVGGAGADILIGGAGNDSLRGNVGSDTLTGNGGADSFVYRSAAESTGTGFDLLIDLKSAEDLLDLHSAVTGWNATVGSGQLSQASFDADLAAALDGALDPGKAILFDPNGGTYAGRHFLVVDGNGDGAYTAGADYVFELGAAAIVDTSGTGLFV